MAAGNIMKFSFGTMELDTIDLKCLLASRGVHTDAKVYEEGASRYNISPDSRRLSCLILPDGTITPFTDVRDHACGETPFSLRWSWDRAVLYYEDDFVCEISFPPRNDFYEQRTSDGDLFRNNAVLQGTDWLTFGYLWPCEFARAGFPCQYCLCGRDTSDKMKAGEHLPEPISGEKMAEIIRYAMEHQAAKHVQITGGSTIGGLSEQKHFLRYLEAIRDHVGRERIPGDIVLYITPPKDMSFIDACYELGADQIGCSVEIWDEELAQIVTPGKMRHTTRQRHLDALQYITEKYGPHHCFCNFVVGIEPAESLIEGARWLAARGITPVVSVIQPMGMKIEAMPELPGLEYFRRIKDAFLELYEKYDLHPAERSGENGCIEEEFYRAVHGRAF